MASAQPCRSRPVPCAFQSPPEQPLQVKVVGLFKSNTFQIAKSTAECLKNNFPSKFEDPIIVPLQEFAWYQYLQEKKRAGFKRKYNIYRIFFWKAYDKGKFYLSVLLFTPADGCPLFPAHHVLILPLTPQHLGYYGLALFLALTLKRFGGVNRCLKNNFPSKFEDPIIVPLQEFAWYQYLQEKKRHDFVFLDISIGFYPIGKLIFELYCDVCPKTCKNFQVLCTGKAGFSQSGVRLHYAGSIFHRLVQNGWLQGGDIVAGKGDGGESIYGPTFEDENFSIPHNKRGVLGMVNKGRHSNGSQFYITLQPTPYLDKKYVAFGQLVEGTEVLQRLELVPTENERPIQQCLIIGSGDIYA
ncbi:peptidyl-prolyl cis-trans isomerase-like 6 [Pteropus vampyrus]|uniref:Probable inactive peptidyl-prolyl cis-trans isomerase-like 6 n=1 Tax=Pteropus vampyrus TaxID=132908 RepID=A0A6P6CQF0_PTEVA|nr:peptidyl-prolyl cis-trans isomerase-like 6 [Pteropus vampyrus]